MYIYIYIYICIYIYYIVYIIYFKEGRKFSERHLQVRQFPNLWEKLF